ncbi:lethal(2)neighbour of tid protein-like [Ornithodoros turicata]|uniref:lethal(2)neighbour of tid protein-like n=1 Tax=Ornithodoros turicata TaxID=34597 RepID=UPI003138870F
MPPRSHLKRNHYHRKNDFFSKYFKVTYNRVMHDIRTLNPKTVFFDPGALSVVVPLLLVAEIALNIVVIEKVPYTEIDWKAYMQEVEGVINGTYDYAQLKGDTGPLVYPAGFVYIFTLLYYVTSHGTNIYLAQYIFAGIYLATIFLVFNIYHRTRKVPPYVLALMCFTSYRIHSIYILRLFCDTFAMLFLYAALACFLHPRWALGCAFYSLAVSVKMNILLFAPALFFVLLSTQGIKNTLIHVVTCGLIQLLLALPFLLSNPVSYVTRAFDLGRVFLYQWTVNWRFIPEEIFLGRPLHFTLLGLHLLCLLCFLPKWIRYLKMRKIGTNKGKAVVMFPDQILLPLLSCNFIGMVFCRSLHYQFYSWYYHSIPYLLWSTRLSTVTKLFIWGLIELSWNTYPSTDWSSLLLLFSHLTLLVELWRHWPKDPDVLGKSE